VHIHQEALECHINTAAVASAELTYWIQSDKAIKGWTSTEVFAGDATVVL